MKNKGICILMVIGMIILSSCATPLKKKVVFWNDLDFTGSEPITMPFNELYSAYVSERDENTLYAFYLEYKGYTDSEGGRPKDEPVESAYESSKEYKLAKRAYKVKKAVEMIESVGLIVLSDYPLCYYNNEEETNIFGECAFVGTLEQVEQLFDGTEPINGFFWNVYSAPRPDLLEKMKKAGWNEVDLISWFELNEEKLRQFIGEENQVTMKVNFETAEK